FRERRPRRLAPARESAAQRAERVFVAPERVVDEPEQALRARTGGSGPPRARAAPGPPRGRRRGSARARARTRGRGTAEAPRARARCAPKRLARRRARDRLAP